MDVLLHSHTDSSGEGGLTAGDHLVNRNLITDYEAQFISGEITASLPINQWRGLNQQLNEQIFNLYKSDVEIASLIPNISDVAYNSVTWNDDTDGATKNVLRDKFESLSGVFQPLDTTLTNLASQNWVLNSMPVGSGSDTVVQLALGLNTFPARSSSGNVAAKSITDFGLSLLDDASNSIARNTLGLGSMAIQNADAVAITGGTGLFENNYGLGVKALSGLGGWEGMYFQNFDFLTLGDITLELFLGGQTRHIDLLGPLEVTAAGASVEGTNTGDVTLSGENYLSISGQVITVGSVNLSGTHVTGTLPVTKLGGTKAQFNTANTDGDFVFTSDIGSTVQAFDSELSSLAGLSVTQGDTIYASASNVYSKLAKDANATRYMSNQGTSNNPSWNQVNLANGVTGDLPFANLTQIAGLSILGVTGNVLADVAAITAGSDGQVLRRSGTTLAFGAIDLSLSAAVSNILTSVNGGTGNGFTKFSGPATSEKTFTLPNSNATLHYDGGPLGTPSSGTMTNVTGLPIATGLSGLGGADRILYSTSATAGATSSIFTFNGTRFGVGIGTSTLNERMAVSAVSGVTWATAFTTNDFNGGTGAGSGFFIGFGAASGNTYTKFQAVSAGFGANNDLVFQVNGGNVKIGGSATRATTDGSGMLRLFNGTAPAGTLTNGADLYCSSGEMRVMDSAGNSTLISPHDTNTNEWIYWSKNTRTGKVLRIDMERIMRRLNDAFGGGYITESYEFSFA